MRAGVRIPPGAFVVVLGSAKPNRSPTRRPPRIQRLHADLLTRCNIDHATYQHRVQNLRPRGVHDTTPYVQDTSNHYKEQLQIEELLRTIKDALSREMNSVNYATHVSRLRPFHFRPDTGCLTLEAPSPLIAAQLNGQLFMLLRRALAKLKPMISGVQVHELVAVPGPPHAWDPDHLDSDTSTPLS